MTTLTPIEQIAADIAALEGQRDTLYAQFRDIETTLAEKRKVLEAFQLMKASTTLQQGLVIEMKNLGVIPA